ncbi:esterase lipoprotein [Gloeomargarita lithophora Alchichica-D10]|uniref:Esterase lipoprotein n=1 Tax=Gloeomargarita lithophora Alchichica-D10 TaxID=1188229 RepID=A0A1J0AAR5_9CYAN|nr:PHB depolymerase family esterase [Gloeomargarita lithophora]APB33028.1 esterase lipoprotein [Gloeomargarita lithophora Alchichica-D10]
MLHLGRCTGGLAVVLGLSHWGGISLVTAQSRRDADPTPAKTLVVNGVPRTYRIAVPPRRAGGRSPLLIALHGGGGTGAGMERLTRLSDLANQAGVIVVYPDGWNRHWHDRRNPRFVPEPGVQDVPFINQLIDEVHRTYTLDQQRIYVTGISNGGFFAQVLACELSHRLAAVAVVSSNLPQGLAENCPATQSVPILYILGTNDPLIPYAGGEIRGKQGRKGVVYSAQASLDFWRQRYRLPATPQVQALPDRVNDQTSAQQITYQNRAVAVSLITIQGGGHTWPGGPQYLPQRFIGRVSQDFDASATIWQFVRRYRRNPSSPGANQSWGLRNSSVNSASGVPGTGV